MKETRLDTVDGAAEVFAADEIIGDAGPVQEGRRHHVAGFIRYQVIGRGVCFFRGHRRGATFHIGDVQTSVCDRCLRRERV